jgi:hypothetical protein
VNISINIEIARRWSVILCHRQTGYHDIRVVRETQVERSFDASTVEKAKARIIPRTSGLGSDRRNRTLSPRHGPVGDNTDDG